MTIFRKKPNTWESVGIEPIAGQRVWAPNQKPPADWFNFFWDASIKCFQDIDTEIEPARGTFPNLKARLDAKDTEMFVEHQITTGQHKRGSARAGFGLAASRPANNANNPGSLYFNQDSNGTYSRTELDTGTTWMPCSCIPIGGFLPFLSDTPPDGWLFCNGKNIGDASSGAQLRANADVWELFNCLWNVPTMYIREPPAGGGVLTTRGASALADWNAHKSIETPHLQGRMLIGNTTMGQWTEFFTVGDENARYVGGIGGEERHILAESEMPTHRHGSDVTGDDGVGTGAGYGPVGYSANIGGGMWFSNWTGGGQPHNNMPPWYVVNYIIRYR